MKKLFLLSIALILTLGMFFNSPHSYADEAINDWVLNGEMPEAISRNSAVELDGMIYIVGGRQGTTDSKALLVYDPTTNVWTTKTSMNTARFLSAVETVNGKIYVISGMQNNGTNLTNAVEEYDPSTDTWTTKASIPTARGGAAVAVINNKIYVIGGTDGKSTATSLVEVYDPTTDKWTTQASIPTARRHLKAVTLDGKIYVSGGSGLNIPTSNAFEVYDSSTDTWSSKAYLNQARGGHGMVVLDGEIYAFGGMSDGVIINSTEKYDPTANTWTTINTSAPSRCFFAYLNYGGKIYLFGGADSGEVNSNDLKSIEVFTSKNNNPDPEQPSGDRAILTITITTGLEKEYDLSMDEVNEFLNWYDTKDAGSGPSKYAIDKHDNNKGPFSKRTDYVIFNNILTFEVNEYSIVTTATY